MQRAQHSRPAAANVHSGKKTLGKVISPKSKLMFLCSGCRVINSGGRRSTFFFFFFFLLKHLDSVWLTGVTQGSVLRYCLVSVVLMLGIVLPLFCFVVVYVLYSTFVLSTFCFVCCLFGCLPLVYFCYHPTYV